MIVEACAVRSKVYALKIKKNEVSEEEDNNSTTEKITEDESEETEDEDEFEEMKRLKGIKKIIVKKRITIRDFKKSLYATRPMSVTFSKIASRKHCVTTNLIRKRALSAFDDKRWMLPCLSLIHI